MTKTISICIRIVISCARKRASLFEFQEKSVGAENTTWPGFSVGGKATVEKILGSEEKQVQKAGM